MTPMCPVRVARTAARAPGSTTPIDRHIELVASVGSACAVAVLHATTMALTPCSMQERADLAAVRARSRATWAVRHARRVAEVDQTLARKLAHDRVRDREPPKPESKTPIGAESARVARRRDRALRTASLTS
jgi:hypothetical protein